MKIRFVLVEPAVPENIGASARALKTMGFDKLVLVKPCTWKEGKSRWVAHGSADVLDNAMVAGSLEEALHDSDLSVATSAKQRSVRQDYVTADKLREFIFHKIGSIQTVSVVFGREESGLTNEEISLCDISSGINMADTYPSINLSHAVMLYAYELSGLRAGTIKEETYSALRDKSSFRQMKSKAGLVLNNLGISDKDNRFGRIMERLSFLEGSDINLVHSICGLFIEKMTAK